MGYRSIKRVLGETSLERKSRLLFGTCLLLLITIAFIWVDRIAETMVREATRSKARDLVDVVLLKRHLPTLRTEFTEFAIEISEALDKNSNYDSKTLTLRPSEISLVESGVPQDSQEKEYLQQIKKEYEAWQKQQESKAEDEPQIPPVGTLGGGVKPPTRSNSFIFRERRWKHEADEYHYYEPIYWQANCYDCHLSNTESGVVPPSEASGPQGATHFSVMKMIIPYDETQDAINRARAILISVAILTVFVAMVALYVIFRYVVVKPLQHLRNVSEQVSLGKTEVRAEIQTGDEFQDLAESFNRMLRHLTEAQHELRQVNTELDSRVDQLAQLNMTLYEMNRVKSDFLANMSHELRTPLNSIIGFSEVLHGIDSLTDKQKRYAQNIQKSGRLLLEMINDILDLAKMEAGKMEIRPTEFQLHTVVQAQCDMVRSLTEEKNIDLEVQVGDDLPPMYQDQAKLQQILTNLLSNAIKFTPEGGRITVKARRDEQGRAELTVTDTGVGIAEEDREVIFEKFRQSATILGEDGLTREYSGTGLGLSIIKELCKLLGGIIHFESEVGTGSRFTVTLPWTHSSSSNRPQASDQVNELARSSREDNTERVTPGQTRVTATSSATVPDDVTDSKGS